MTGVAEPIPPQPPASLGNARPGLDLFTSYLASFVRVFSWVLVSALLVRAHGAADLGVLAAVRAASQLVWYFAPAVLAAALRQLAAATTRDDDVPRSENAADHTDDSTTLSYAVPREERQRVSEVISAIRGATWIITVLVPLLTIAAVFLTFRFDAGSTGGHVGLALILCAAGGVRLFSESTAARIQIQGKLFLDNLLVIAADLAWLIAVIAAGSSISLNIIVTTLLLAQIGLLVLRLFAASVILPVVSVDDLQSDGRAGEEFFRDVWRLYFASLADFLYAPTALLIAGSFLGAAAAAAYAAAIQIDGALLLLVAGLSTFLLPRAAAAFAANDFPSLRKHFVRGSFVSLGLMTAAALVVGTLAPLLSRLWLDDKVDDFVLTLRLVLVHTVLGSAAGVGRAILLGIGRFKAWTISAILAGLANAVLALLAVTVFDLGLPGVVFSTVLVVFVRCVLWMPAYIWLALRNSPPSVR